MHKCIPGIRFNPLSLAIFVVLFCTTAVKTRNEILRVNILNTNFIMFEFYFTIYQMIIINPYIIRIQCCAFITILGTKLRNKAVLISSVSKDFNVKDHEHFANYFVRNS